MTDFYEVFFCRQQWTYSYGKRAQTNQSRKFVIYFLPKSAAILTQKKTVSCPVSGPPHTPQCLLGELWRAHADKKTGETHGLYSKMREMGLALAPIASEALLVRLTR